MTATPKPVVAKATKAKIAASKVAASKVAVSKTSSTASKNTVSNSVARSSSTSRPPQLLILNPAARPPVTRSLLSVFDSDLDTDEETVPRRPSSAGDCASNAASSTTSTSSSSFVDLLQRSYDLVSENEAEAGSDAEDDHSHQANSDDDFESAPAAASSILPVVEEDDPNLFQPGEEFKDFDPDAVAISAISMARSARPPSCQKRVKTPATMILPTTSHTI